MIIIIIFFLDFENKLKQKSLYKFYTIKFDSWYKKTETQVPTLLKVKLTREEFCEAWNPYMWCT